MSDEKDKLKETESNQTQILNEENPKGTPSNGFDFKKENEVMKDRIETRKKELERERDKRIIKKKTYVLWPLIIYSVMASLVVIGLLCSINKKVSVKNEISSEKVPISTVKQKNIIFSKTIEDVTCDINEIKVSDSTITLKYTLINKGEDIQPLIENSFITDSTNIRLTALSQVNNMKSKIIKKNGIIEGTIVFTNKPQKPDYDSKGNIKADKKVKIEGNYKYTIPVLCKNEVVDLDVDFKI